MTSARIGVGDDVEGIPEKILRKWATFEQRELCEFSVRSCFV